MSDLLSRLDQHEFPTKDVPLCLKPKLIAERDEAMSRVASARRAQTQPTGDDRMVAPATSPALAAAIADVKAVNDQIQAASVVIRLTGVDRLTYNRFVLACPPRKGKAEPFDPSKFFMHVARQTGAYVDREGNPHPITSEEWDAIDKKLGDGEHDRIAEAIIEVNRSVGAQDVSFFVNGSETTPDSSETSD